MAQHDYNIADATGANVRADLNNAFTAIASSNSGPSAPTTTFANMWWFDTTNDLLKVRDEANSAWVTVAKKDGNGWTPYRQGTALGTASVQDDTRYAHRANNLSDLASAATARTNLGLGSAATRNTEATVLGGGAIPLSSAVVAHVAAQNPVKARVNFNGTGTVAIRASFNVSSITDNGTNNYTVNLTNAMSNADYVVNSSATLPLQSNNQAYNTPSVENLTVNGFDLKFGATGAESDLWMATVIGD